MSPFMKRSHPKSLDSHSQIGLILGEGDLIMYFYLFQINPFLSCFLFTGMVGGPNKQIWHVKRVSNVARSLHERPSTERPDHRCTYQVRMKIMSLCFCVVVTLHVFVNRFCLLFITGLLASVMSSSHCTR